MTLPLNAELRNDIQAPLASELPADDVDAEEQMQPGRTHEQVTRERLARLKATVAAVGGELPESIDGIPVEQLDQKETNVATGQPKRVKCVQTGEIFVSISAAERAKGLSPGRVFNALDKEGKRAGGFTWVSADEGAVATPPPEGEHREHLEPPPVRRASETMPARKRREASTAPTDLSTTAAVPTPEISVAAAADPEPSPAAAAPRSSVTVFFVKAENVDISGTLAQLLQRLTQEGGN